MPTSSNFLKGVNMLSDLDYANLKRYNPHQAKIVLDDILKGIDDTSRELVRDAASTAPLGLSLVEGTKTLRQLYPELGLPSAKDACQLILDENVT